MTELERRYLRLLRAYPAEYRRSRGAEIVGTYLDLAAAGRRWPSPADAADLLRGGARQRLRAAGVASLIPGVRLAALLSMVTASVLAGVWGATELHPVGIEWATPHLGPFVSIGVIAWAGWLLAAIATAVAPSRVARLAIALALLLTLALPPLAAALDAYRPPLFVLLPQVILGLLALALPDRPATTIRLAPLLSAGTAVAATELLVGLDGGFFSYSYTALSFLPTVGGLLLVVAALLAIGLAIGGDTRGGWALVTLLTPAAFLAVPALGDAIDPIPGGVSSAALAASTAAVALVGPAVLLLTIRARARPTASTTHDGEASPTCTRTTPQDH